MTENKRVFVGSDGRPIEFLDGHVDLLIKHNSLTTEIAQDHLHSSTNVAGGHQQLDYEQAAETFNEMRRILSLKGYASRLAATYGFISMLEETSIKPKFSKLLDIGTGYGIHPRILRGMGMVERVEGCDLYDRCTGIDERALRRTHRRLWLLRIVDWFKGIDADGFLGRLPLMRQLIAASQSVYSTRLSVKEWGRYPDRDIYKVKIKSPMKLDEYIQGNFYDINRRYDLITSFSSLEWFKYVDALPKISNLLDGGGVFYLWVPSWWACVAPAMVGGDFPFAAQRLTRDDFFRYLDEHLPQYAPAQKISYDYHDPDHPTFSDYLRVALENNLVPVKWHHEIIPTPFGGRSFVGSISYALSDVSETKRILAEIQRFRPDVGIEDLMVYAHRILFVKANPDRRLDKSEIDRVLRRAGERPELPRWMQSIGRAFVKLISTNR